MTASQHL